MHQRLVELKVVKGTENVADLGTKYLEPGVFNKFIALLGIELLAPTVAKAAEIYNDYNEEETGEAGTAVAVTVQVVKKMRRTARLIVYLELDVEVFFVGLALGIAISLIIMSIYSKATRFCKRRRRGDPFDRLRLQGFYKAATGTRMHSEENCRYLDHLSETQREALKLQWCFDCRRNVSNRCKAILMDAV